ncbi:hypothetical protein ACFFRR_003741 [Megaselia abdita]
MLRIFRNLYITSTRSVFQTRNCSALKEEAKINPFHGEYIVNYDSSLEKIARQKELVQILKEKYAVSERDTQKLLQDYNSKRTTKSFGKTLDILLHNGFKKSTLIEHPWLITADPNQLQKKMDVLFTLKIRDTNDFAPFLKLSLNQLQRVTKHLRDEAKIVGFDNRVYYISEKLKVPPNILTQYLSRRLFMLEMPMEFLNANLENMITYGVASINILKDLWAFRYTPNSVRSRLERAKIAQKDKLMPWMVRCPERILQRSLKITMDEKELLGSHNNIVEYIADRLGFSIDMTEAILKKHPPTLRVRATKIKEVLDYILDEAGYSPHDVGNAPRILCHSLETTKERLEELKSIDCRPISLVIVCRSKNEYEKFVRKWKDSKKYSNKT